MNGLAATLIQSAIARYKENRLPDSALYLWAARRFDEDPAMNGFISAFHSQTLDRIEDAQRRQDFDLALRLDALNTIFAPDNRLRLDPSVAAQRASLRCLDAERALSQGELEAAAAFSLAARALDPESALARRRLMDAVDGMRARCQTLDRARPTQSGTLTLALVVALGGDDQRQELASLLYGLGDFDAVARLCREVEEDPDAGFTARLDSTRLRLQAGHRALGADAPTAEARAAPELRAWLVGLGSSADLEEEALRTRVALCFSHEGFRRTLADLRELRRRSPDDPWVAYNLCVILHNAFHPDVAETVDLVVRHSSDELADLQARYVLLSLIGATKQALAIAERLVRHHPEYAVIGALHNMATDLDATPDHVFERPRKAGSLLYANLVCWGDRYVDLLERAAIPSLLAPRNIPHLAAKVDVVIDLFTMPADFERLRDSPAIRRLAAYCEIRIWRFSETIAALSRPFAYATYGHALHATALRAERDQADLTFLMPDLIYADGAYEAIAERVTNGPRAIFVDGLNAYADPMIEALAPFRQDEVLQVPPQDLIQAALERLSKRTLHSLYEPGDGRTCGSPTRVIFPMENGLRTHAFLMMPIYVSHAALTPFVMKNFATQDGLMTEHILNAVTEDQLEVLSAREFCYVEVCEDDGAFRPMVEQDLVSAIRAWFTNFGYGRNRLRLFSRPVEFPTRSPPPFALVSEEEAAARVRDVQRLFAEDPMMVDVAEEQERVRRAHYR